ncbi:MAG TPA: ABC transporter substrate-binding protein [Armatimonadota bacterium]|nr:ABC transporter substrate-binding protein [Armatimonadota bacterium]
MTGPASTWGQFHAKGQQDYFKYVNEVKGGVAGKKIETILVDTGYRVPEAIAAVHACHRGGSIIPCSPTKTIACSRSAACNVVAVLSRRRSANASTRNPSAAMASASARTWAASSATTVPSASSMAWHKVRRRSTAPLA